MLVVNVTFWSAVRVEFAGGGDMGTERGQSTEEGKKMRVHNTYRTYRYLYLVLRIIYLVLLYVRTKKAQRSTTQHRTAPQGKPRHRAAPHGAALLNYSLYIAGLS